MAIKMILVAGHHVLSIFIDTWHITTFVKDYSKGIKINNYILSILRLNQKNLFSQVVVHTKHDWLNEDSYNVLFLRFLDSPPPPEKMSSQIKKENLDQIWSIIAEKWNIIWYNIIISKRNIEAVSNLTSVFLTQKWQFL